MRICPSLNGSPTRYWGTSGATVKISGRCFCSAGSPTISRTFFNTSSSEKGMRSRVSLPDSILETSRMSFIIASSFRAAMSILVRYVRCLLSGLARSARWAIPVIAFTGVRISWLILARNSDLDWFATSASILALLEASSACLISVMSRLLSITSRGRPFPSRCNTQRLATTMRVPS